MVHTGEGGVTQYREAREALAAALSVPGGKLSPKVSGAALHRGAVALVAIVAAARQEVAQ